MQKKWLWVFSFMILLIIVGLIAPRSIMRQEPLIENGASETTQFLQQTTTTFPITEFTASFDIYTLGTKRIFTDSRYHDLSEKVYIPADSPEMVIVTDPSSTWSDLFESLPMSLSEECLTTGTNQTFCTNDTYRLRFFINDNEDPGVLDKQIKEGDSLKVTYE